MPRKLISQLRELGHEAESVHTMGWAGTKNGELLALVAPAFDMLFTKDEEFARRISQSSYTVVCVRVALSQQPQDPYVAEFMKHFATTNWADFESGNDWPTAAINNLVDTP